MRIQSRLVPLSLTVLSLVMGSSAACSKKAVETVETTEAVAVSVQPARMDALKSTIAATGTIAPAPSGDWTITAPQQGTIAELPKNEGDDVKVGDLLVRFDIPGLTADLSARRSELAQANARVVTAKATAERLSGLADKGIAARKDALDAQLAQTEAQEAVKQATTAEAAAAVLADRAVIRARFAGVVAKRSHNVGDQVDAATTDPVLRVIDPARAEVVASVPVAALARIVVTRPAEITNPASPTPETAMVSSRPGTVDSGSSTAEVRLRFTSPTKMAIGTPVGIEIIADERASALVIPAAAVVKDGDEVFVMVAGADNKAHKHPVKLGLTTRESVEVLDGVKVGDLVIVRGQDGLPDGAAITVAK